MRNRPGNCAELEREMVSGNIFIRPGRFQKEGEFVDGHQHNFDHTTIFFKGTFKVETLDPDGIKNEYIFIAPSHLLIKKEVEHKITLIEEEVYFVRNEWWRWWNPFSWRWGRWNKYGGLMWCVYSHRDQNGEVVQEHNNNMESYG